MLWMFPHIWKMHGGEVMITGQGYGEDLTVAYAEFSNISKELLPWLEVVSYENNCRIEKKEWKSKYNSYVVYDYEPFCADGFEISVTLSSSSTNYIKFIQFLYEHKLRTIDHLKKCLEV